MRLTYRFDWNRHKKVKFPGKKGHSAGSAVALRPWPGFTAFRRTVKIGGACAVLIFLAGCLATGVQPPAKRPNPPPPVHLHAEEVIETATGRAIGMDQLAANLSRVAVVYVGEEHTSVQDHGVQLEILRRLSRSGRCVELAMEMFPANSQPVLDRYIHGQMSERHFLREVKWNEVWGFPYSLYKGLIDWQKQNHMPVIGLNAPYPVVRKIARHGLGSLTPVERSQVARVFHMDNPEDGNDSCAVLYWEPHFLVILGNYAYLSIDSSIPRMSRLNGLYLPSQPRVMGPEETLCSDIRVLFAILPVPLVYGP